MNTQFINRIDSKREITQLLIIQCKPTIICHLWNLSRTTKIESLINGLKLYKRAASEMKWQIWHHNIFFSGSAVYLIFFFGLSCKFNELHSGKQKKLNICWHIMYTILAKKKLNRWIDNMILPDCCVHISSSGSWRHEDAGVHNICKPKEKEKTLNTIYILEGSSTSYITPILYTILKMISKAMSFLRH